jgi:transcription antitermination protein NusB
VSTSPESDAHEEGEPLLGTRRQARELALSLLYEADTKTATPAEVLAEFPIDPDPFASDLVAGVGEHQADIDDLIRRFAKDWTIDRMPVVDRNLLRIGIYELLQRPDVPTAAVISEAVELARRYSTEESGRFVNGMLGRIAEEVRAGR